jgi:hypothetical protein
MKPNKWLTQSVLQCLIVVIWPLRVEKLVEVLADNFNDGKGIPRLKPD